MSMKSTAAVLLAASCVFAVSADTIVLKGGSRLEGEVVRIVGGEVTFKNDELGELKIKEEKIASIETKKASTVQYNDRQTEQGVVGKNSDGYTLGGKELDMKEEHELKCRFSERHFLSQPPSPRDNGRKLFLQRPRH